MFDGGPPQAMDKFIKYLDKYSIDPKEIKLIVLSHTDFDHAGSAEAIREITGAKIAVHKADLPVFEEGRFNWPPGVTAWGKISHALFEPFMKRTMKVTPQKKKMSNHFHTYMNCMPQI